ncbi:MAG: chemotaxis protein CheX [Acidobacteriia bacterium]|nr:chemotaxis protein CheX [Terriglobia bacterium]
MKIELIQPFINAADAVFSEAFQSPTKIGDMTMDEESYRLKGVAALIRIEGEIEGRVILDVGREAARKMASHLSGGEAVEGEQIETEAVCELANMVIGNSVTLLNDKGFKFKIHPPEIHTSQEGIGSNRDTEAMVLSMETPYGDIYLNIAMHYLHRRRQERETSPAAD